MFKKLIEKTWLWKGFTKVFLCIIGITSTIIISYVAQQVVDDIDAGDTNNYTMDALEITAKAKNSTNTMIIVSTCFTILIDILVLIAAITPQYCMTLTYVMLAILVALGTTLKGYRTQCWYSTILQLFMLGLACDLRIIKHKLIIPDTENEKTWLWKGFTKVFLCIIGITSIIIISYVAQQVVDDIDAGDTNNYTMDALKITTKAKRYWMTLTYLMLALLVAVGSCVMGVRTKCCTLIIIIAAAVVLSNADKDPTQSDEEWKHMKKVTIAVIATIGTIAMLVEMLGLIGAVKEHYCLTMTYAILMALITLSSIGGAVRIGSFWFTFVLNVLIT
ncbi:unnamed protein product, partial [Medioppia subpectinata]